MPIMHLQTGFTWVAKRFVNRVGADAEATDAQQPDKDTRKAVKAEDLDPEWVQALANADYSHLPKLKKQTA